jgi:hypothetical protein
VCSVGLLEAAPAPFFGRFAEPGADRILEDVGDRCVEVILVVDDPGRVAVAEQMSLALVPSVEALRVDAVEAVDAAGHQLNGRLEQQVVVRAHEAVSDAAPAEAADALPEQLEELQPVLVVNEDERVLDSVRRDVKEAVGEVGSKPACHAPTVARSNRGAAVRRHKSHRWHTPMPGSAPRGSDPGERATSGPD